MPIVTAREDSPSTVMSAPLTTPQRTPTSRQQAMTAQMLHPVSRHRTPMTALVRPAVLATDRSISPVTMISVIGIAISRIGTIPTSRKPRVTVEAKLTTIVDAASTTASRTRNSIVSLRPYDAREEGRRRGLCLGWSLVRVSLISGLTDSELVGTTDGGDPVDDDRGEDQHADDRLLPELVDARAVSELVIVLRRTAPRAAPTDGADAAGDRDAADHRSGDDVELDAGSGGRADRVEAGGVEDAGQTGRARRIATNASKTRRRPGCRRGSRRRGPTRSRRGRDPTGAGSGRPPRR